MVMRVPAPTSGGLMLTYKCCTSCRHCMYACFREWPADWLSSEMMEDILKWIKNYIQPAPGGPNKISLNHGLHFTGERLFFLLSSLS